MSGLKDLIWNDNRKHDFKNQQSFEIGIDLFIYIGC